MSLRIVSTNSPRILRSVAEADEEFLELIEHQDDPARRGEAADQLLEIVFAAVGRGQARIPIAGPGGRQPRLRSECGLEVANWIREGPDIDRTEPLPAQPGEQPGLEQRGLPKPERA